MWSGKAKVWKQCQRVLSHAQSLFYTWLWTDKANHCQAGEARTLWIPHRHLRCNGLSIFVVHFSCHGSVWRWSANTKGSPCFPRFHRTSNLVHVPLVLRLEHESYRDDLPRSWLSILYWNSSALSVPKPPYHDHSSLRLPWVYLLPVLNWRFGG